MMSYIKKIANYPITILSCPLLLFISLFFLLPYSNWHDIYFYVVIVLPFIFLINKKFILTLFNSKIYISIISFIFYMWLSTFWSENTSINEILRYGRYSFSLLIFVSLFIILSTTMNDFILKVYKYIIISAGIGAFISIIWFYHTNDFNFNNRLLVFFGRHESPVLASSTYGVVLVLSFSLKKYWSNQNKLKVISYISVIIIMSSILLSQSRGPILALYITFLLFTIYNKNNIMTSLLLIIPLLIYTVYVYFDVEFGTTISRGLSYRFDMFYTVIEKAKDQIICGHGLLAKENIVISNGLPFLHPHSAYLSTFFYGGIVGIVFLFILLFLCFIEATISLIYEKDSMTIGVLLFTCLSIISDTNKLVTKPSTWFYFWIPISICATTEIKMRCKNLSFFHINHNKLFIEGNSNAAAPKSNCNHTNL